MHRTFCVYMMASRKNGTLYIGVTNDIVRRASEYREGEVEGFTKKHGIKHLVWFEVHDNIDAAITREKQIKEWQRTWKVRLIEEANPEWRDLWWDLTDQR